MKKVIALLMFFALLFNTSCSKNAEVMEEVEASRRDQSISILYQPGEYGSEFSHDDLSVPFAVLQTISPTETMEEFLHPSINFHAVDIYYESEECYGGSFATIYWDLTPLTDPIEAETDTEHYNIHTRQAVGEAANFEDLPPNYDCKVELNIIWTVGLEANAEVYSTEDLCGLHDTDLVFFFNTTSGLIPSNSPINTEGASYGIGADFDEYNITLQAEDIDEDGGGGPPGGAAVPFILPPL